MLRRFLRMHLFALAISIAPAVGQDAVNKSFLEALDNPQDEAAFGRYLASLPKSTMPINPGVIFYIIEGDLAMTATQVREDLAVKRAKRLLPVESPKTELYVHTILGAPIYWKDRAHRTLRYAVWKASFDGPLGDKGAMYRVIVKAMEEAAGDWEAICPECGIKFVHVKELDNPQGLATLHAAVEKDDLRFYVYYKPGNPTLFAKAFFPGDFPEKRNLMIAGAMISGPAIASGKLTRRGILRHEIGHILGYRHSHIYVPKVGASWECPNEIDWATKPIELGPYDPLSVMHYDCGPSENKGDDKFTEWDILSHRQLYGSTPK